MRWLLVLSAALALAGCSASSATPVLTVAPMPSAVPATPTATPAGGSSIVTLAPEETRPIVTPTPPPTPSPLDAAQFVADLESGAALNKYPGVAAAALTKQYNAMAASDPHFVVVANFWAPSGKSNLDLCLNVKNNEHTGEWSGGCYDLMADLARYANQTGSPAAVALFGSAVGYVIHTTLYFDNGTADSNRAHLARFMRLKIDFMNDRPGSGPS
jgi:hypothetical protein